ncbi:MAG: carbon-nitrogen hydrolase [Cyclobacteriaceae bacterium]|nr:carbon-nitrogen hydrolase [Cyclobacteriaceae bacterium]
MSSMVQIGVVQMACGAEPKDNLGRIIQEIGQAATKGAQIICLQELFKTRYFCYLEHHDNFSLAESVPGPTTEVLQSLASERQVVLIASLFEKRTHGLYHNTVAVIDADGSYLGKYRKMHIPDDPGYYEKFYFTPGDLGYRVFNTRYAKIGTLICWDQWFPEAARLTTLMGAEILFYPTAIGWDQSQEETTNKEQFEAWQTVQRAHAVANGVHVVSVNRVGTEGQMDFWGGSMVVNPMGRVLWQAGREEVTKVVPVELADSDYYRTHWPFLRDRRVDSYGDITKRFLDQP